MRFFKGFTHIVAVGEKSGGNESVGDMWLETKVFPKETTMEKIIFWAKKVDISGRLIITVAEPSKETNDAKNKN